MNRRLIAWVSGLVVGTVVGLGVWSAGVAGADAHRQLEAPGDRVLTAIDGLAESQVHLAPDLRDQIEPGRLRQISAAAEAADPQVFVVVWTESYDAGYDSEAIAAAQIAAGVDRPGMYLLTDGEGGATDRAHEVDLTSAPDSSIPGRLDQALLRYIDDVDAAEQIPAAERQFFEYGPPSAAVILGVMLALMCFAGLMVTLGLLRRVAGHPFLLPGGVVGRHLPGRSGPPTTKGRP